MRKKILVLTAMLVLVCSTAFAYVGNTRTGKFQSNVCQKATRNTLKQEKKQLTKATCHVRCVGLK